ncbi:hypothetical protein JD844_014865 [Phrynosoma platyrhinos]|uniref:MHC class I antigen n=1 Tax=Phrynosoma platyrhinos TaxID=52577 RepID=A0ABQ7T6T0_PHRPL|nr:hypothetical protein JD844_014865 [Phrynosoma platyrhinos]
MQIPFILLNASTSEIRPRMYPVFFGESIEVNPEPVQEISGVYEWIDGCFSQELWVGGDGVWGGNRQEWLKLRRVKGGIIEEVGEDEGLPLRSHVKFISDLRQKIANSWSAA